MTKVFRAWLKNEDGATAIEYALIAGLISIVIVGTAQAVGSDLINVFELVSSGLQTVPTN
jgi:pilus assembly protein Flp/PilA